MHIRCLNRPKNTFCSSLRFSSSLPPKPSFRPDNCRIRFNSESITVNSSSILYHWGIKNTKKEGWISTFLVYITPNQPSDFAHDFYSIFFRFLLHFYSNFWSKAWKYVFLHEISLCDFCQSPNPVDPHKHWYFKAFRRSLPSSRTGWSDRRNKALAQHTAESLKLLINNNVINLRKCQM